MRELTYVAHSLRRGPCAGALTLSTAADPDADESVAGPPLRWVGHMRLHLLAATGVRAGHVDLLAGHDDVAVLRAGLDVAVMAREAFTSWIRRPHASCAVDDLVLLRRGRRTFLFVHGQAAREVDRAAVAELAEVM